MREKLVPDIIENFIPCPLSKVLAVIFNRRTNDQKDHNHDPHHEEKMVRLLTGRQGGIPYYIINDIFDEHRNEKRNCEFDDSYNERTYDLPAVRLYKLQVPFDTVHFKTPFNLTMKKG